MHNNLESFTSWLRAEVAPDLKALLNREEALTWVEVHERLGRSGVELRKRGAGLVFSHRTEKLFVKASAVGREFSLKKMQARLGSFEPAREGEGSTDPDKVYRPKPRSSAKLWHRYREEMSQRKAMREERRLAAMASWRERRRKLTEFRKSTRSRLFGLLRGKCGIEERVRHRAALGENLPERINGMESSGKRPVAANRIADWDCAVVDGGRKAVYSRAGVKGRVIDQGKRLELGETWSEASIKVALKLAAVKFGRRPIRLTGSDEYRMAVLRVEKRKRTGVRFQDEIRLGRLLEGERSRENDGR